MSERDPRLYCEDILESGSAILDFVKGCLLMIFVMTERLIQLLSENLRLLVKQWASFPNRSGKDVRM